MKLRLLLDVRSAGAFTAIRLALHQASSAMPDQTEGEVDGATWSARIFPDASDGQTHYEGCWRSREAKHVDCSVNECERLTALLGERAR